MELIYVFIISVFPSSQKNSQKHNAVIATHTKPPMIFCVKQHTVIMIHKTRIDTAITVFFALR